MTGFDGLQYASHTDVGIRRSHNQDAHVLVPAGDLEQFRQRGHIFLVADGMGAHAVGELASKIAVDTVPHVYSKHANQGPGPALRKAFVEANAAINTRGRQNKEFTGMGTTGTALLLRPEGAWVGHVGDSRAYRVRAGLIEQLSFDHSLLWELARRQGKNPDELQGIPSNVIVRSLGPEPLVEVDVEGPHPLEPGDVYLLCSDGLSGLVTDREIGAVASALPPDETCRFLTHLANLHGGPDNITVIAARLGGESKPVPSDSQVLFPSGEVPRPSARFLWQRRLRRLFTGMPRAFLLLVVGIVLAGIAIALANQRLPGDFPIFLLAGVSLLAGIVLVMIESRREKHREKTAEAVKPLPIYRQTACTVDEALLQRLTQATTTLEANVRDKGWPINLAALTQHAKQAQQYRGMRLIFDAFREQCRALLVLMETVHQQRGRGESFDPRWEGRAL